MIVVDDCERLTYDASDPCSNEAPCRFCDVGGRVTCVRCKRSMGCHLKPTPLVCADCRAREVR